ncbi:MAG: glycine--tRNA ligase subunit beta [Clostridia bacterium]|nr:glycine--tRNA ligase subunit beta [Clostridia bacterium]
MNGVAELVLEIGVEEMPAGVVAPALAQLAERAGAALAAARLAPASLESWGTPRRLTLYGTGVPEEQEPLRTRIRGPAAAVAFDAEGKPTRAALGFARAQGVGVADLQVEETPSGPYVFAEKVTPGRSAIAVLAEVLPQVVLGIEFPRSMRWGDGDARFVRPIRWVLALLDDAVVPFRLAGVESDRTTRGHRFLAPEPVVVPRASAYRQVLAAACVVVDPRERESVIRGQVEAAARQIGGRAVVEPDLLAEVTYLVEHPTAFVGRFDPSFLALPREVLTTVMRVHQRYFPVEDGAGHLLPAFVAVRNGDTRSLDVVVAGNEKVLRARLTDARFFYDEDRRRPLADRVPDLEHVVFQEQLGTMADKVRRVRRLAAWLATAAGLEAWEREALDRAALLCKADLLTAMVYEFPELQGVMGREYARLAGEAEAVAQAIYEHLLPRFAGDELPLTAVGAALAVADKLDTVVGGFGAGLQPTGSQDPYGLRRQALGILSILRGGMPEVPLTAAVREAAAGYGFGEDVVEAVLTFFGGRLRGQMAEAGHDHDVVEAVLARGFGRVSDVWARAAALERCRREGPWDDVATVYRRAANLSRSAPSGALRAERLAEPAERELYEALAAAEPRARGAAGAGRYDDFFAAVASLRGPLDRFLDAVLVMSPDPEERANRLALLRRTADLAGLVAELDRLA